LTVQYEDESATINYPIGVSGTAKLEFPVEKQKVISLRLEIRDEDDKPSHGLGMDVGNDSPWPASSLSSQTRIACGFCFGTIAEPSDRSWKDLPREHWAELMDLWHCHKPHTENPKESTVVDKGYSAHNRPHLRKGLAFVDTCHVFLPSEELSNTQVCKLL
jgi:ubiquitin-protein ligase E3 D